ncbi:hypothetical protein FQN57_006049 [Myotisia sp. PD_48]|nr:hypothetical protein FQN57_006049 [Myotisia sp. PD_48]
MFKTWISSYFSCIWPNTSEQAPPSQMHNNAVNGEMAVHQNQPRLLPPMKLVLYDNIPDSPRVDPRPSFVSNLVHEGRNLVAKASNRASLSTRRNPARSRHKVKISEPFGFKHLTAEPRRSKLFRPLELTIHLPGNQLPELPVFGDFDVHRVESPQPPPKAHHSPIHRDSDTPFPFKVSRKAVGSISDRDSKQSNYMEVHDHRIAHNHQNDRFIDHQYAAVEDVVYPKEVDFYGDLSSIDGSAINSMAWPSTQTPSNPARHSTSSNSTIGSRLLSQWLSIKSTSSATSTGKSSARASGSSHCRSSTASTMPRFSRSRGRNLSGSTMASSAVLSTQNNSGRSPSFSSSVTLSPSSHPPLSFRGMTEKDCEFASGNAFNYKPTPLSKGSYPPVSQEEFRRIRRQPRNWSLRSSNIGVAF